jgi:two-component system, NarL family, sensor histidine kinase UhpB
MGRMSSVAHPEAARPKTTSPEVARSEAAFDSHAVKQHRLPLFWRVFLPNAFVLIAAGAFLSLSPARVPAPTSLSKVVVLVGGLGAMIVINLVLMRREFHPLERLISLMRAVDPLEPGKRIPVYGGGAEVVELTGTFNEMLDRLETERREYARRSLAANEEERRRLARELHDQIGQTVTALMLQLGSAARAEPGALPQVIEEAAETGRSVLDDLHRVVRQLRPEALDDLGLARALDALCDRVASAAGMQIRRSLQTDLPQLSPEEELVFYRVAQESLTNVVRHAGASTAYVSLDHRDSAVVLEVRDNGSGLPLETDSGTGIRGMKERALLIGAQLSLRSLPKGGAEVRLSLPIGGGGSDG